MSRNTTAYVIALLLAGMGTGYGIARLARTPAPEKAGPVLPEAMHSAQESLHDERTSDLKREKEILSDRVSELVDENNVLRASVEQLRSELAGALASAAAAKRTPLPATSPRIKNATGDGATRLARGRDVFDKNGRMSNAFAKDANLSQDERTRIDDTLGLYRDKLRQLELDNAKINYASDSELSVTVEPFKEEGKVIRDDLLSELGRIVSSKENMDILSESLNGNRMMSPFNFGGTPREIKISMIDNAAGQPSYTIRESGGSGSLTMAPSTTMMSFSSVGQGAIQITSGAAPADATSKSSGTYSSTTVSTTLPEQYKHFFPETAFPAPAKR